MADRALEVTLSVGIAVALGAWLCLASIPVSHSFSFTDVKEDYAPGVTPCSLGAVSIPAGAHVTFTWRAVHPVNQTFGAVDRCLGSTMVYYVSTGQGGSGSFTSQGGLITFASAIPSGPAVNQTLANLVGANVSGTYSIPIVH